MQEATLRWIETPACDCRRNLIPSHPPVNIAETVAPPVTAQLTAFRQIRTASSILGNIPDKLSHSFRPSLLRKVMQSIPATTRFCQRTDRTTDTSKSARLFRKLRLEASAGQQNQPPSPLRDSVIRGIFYCAFNRVSQSTQTVAKPYEWPLPHKTWHVLHHYRLRIEFLYEAEHLVD